MVFCRRFEKTPGFLGKLIFSTAIASALWSPAVSRGAAGVNDARPEGVTLTSLTSPVYDRPWQITSYAADAGLTHQRVFDIAFETNGNVWLATDVGLRRFNGYNWQLFDTNSGLPSSFVRALWMTSGGELWVGTDKGAGVFDFRRNRYDSRGSEKGLAGPNVRQICEDPDGTLWFCCDQWPETSKGNGGLTSLREGRWETFDRQSGMPLDYVISYFRDSVGRQFAMTPRGWAQRNGDVWAPPRDRGYELEEGVLHMAEGAGGVLFAQGERTLLAMTNRQWQIQDSGTVAVASTSQGEVIAARWQGTRGTLRFDLWDGKKFNPASSPVSCQPGARVYRIRQSPDGAIWCVGYGIVLQWAYRSGQWTFYPELPAPATLDPRGRVWFGSDSSVVVLQNGNLQKVSQLKQLLEIAPDGTVLGMDSRRSKPVLMNLDYPERTQLVDCGIETVVRTLCDAEGRLWILGYGKDHSTLFARRDGLGWKTFSSPELKTKRIGSASADPKHGIWAVLQSTEQVGYDLIRVLDSGLEWQTFPSGRPPTTYPNFTIAAGRCWMHGYAGLYQRSLDSADPWQSVSPFEETGVGQMGIGENDLLFVYPGGRSGNPGCALYSDGVWRFHSGEFDRVAVSPDRKTFLLGSRGGVYIRRVPGTLDLRYLPLPSDAIVGRMVPSQDGSLWIGTAEGVFHYRPSTVPPDTRISAALTEVRQDAALPVSFRGVKRFSANDPAGAFRYSWRFNGGAWSRFEEVGNVLSLPPLKPGQHHLEVRACDADDNVDPTPTVLDFAVLDVPLQQRMWFRPAVGFLVCLIGYLSWIGITRTRQIALSNTALRQEVAVRRRTEGKLQQAHDELEQRVAERTAELSCANESLSREITERKQAEATQRQLEEQLRQSQKMEAIGTLAGGIAHDFNNILAVIIPYTQLALEDIKGQDGVRDKLDRVLIAADRARNLVQQILAFSRHQKQQRRVMDLGPLVEEAVKLLRPALPATIQIDLDLAAGTSPVLADSTQIHQVLMNLCTNAEHAMRGHLGVLEIKLAEVKIDEISVRRHPELHVGHYVKLSIRDNGTGISEEVQRRIFDPFFTTKEPGEGTGLGLAVVHGIIKNHDGVIELQSQPGVGTRFDVYLPAHNADPVPIEFFPDAVRLPAGAGEHILLVDDEPAVGDVLCAMLTRGGFRVTNHTNPVEALDDFRDHPGKFDLVLTDLTMPGMTGIDLARRLFEIRPDLPVLLTTGFGGSWEPKAVRELGIRKVIQKPTDFGSIGVLVHDAIHGNGHDMDMGDE